MPDMNDPMGYYTTLGLAPAASADQIRQAYRDLAMRLHPDRNPGRDTTQAFQTLQAAYAALKDDVCRAAYDAYAEADVCTDDSEYENPQSASSVTAPTEAKDDEALGVAVIVIAAVMCISIYVWSWHDAFCYVLGPVLGLALLSDKVRHSCVVRYMEGYEQAYHDYSQRVRDGK